MSLVRFPPHVAGVHGYVINGTALGGGTSGHLSRTIGSAGNRSTWVFEAIIRLADIATSDVYLSAGTSSSNFTSIGRDSSSRIYVSDWNGSYTWRLISDRALVDPDAYYHLVVAYDDTQTTSTNRVRAWINGEALTWGTASYPAQNDGASEILNSVEHLLGKQTAGSGANDHSSAYTARYALYEGLAITDPVTDGFGELTDEGFWGLPRPAHAYGDNGFLLEGGDDIASGTDRSGNGNNFTPSGTITVTNDSPTDSEIRRLGVFANLTPLAKHASATQGSGGLAHGTSSAADWYASMFSLQTPTSGKWGWEVTFTSGTYAQAGLASSSVAWWTAVGGSINPGVVWNFQAGTISKNGSTVATVTASSTSDVHEFLYDVDDATLYLKRNGSLVATVTGVGAECVWPFVATYGTANLTIDCGQSGHTPSEAGYKTLATQNMDAPTISDPSEHFKALTYNGDGTTSHAISGVGFQPDFVWVKRMDTSADHRMADAVRGATKYLVSNGSYSQATSSENILSFDSDGFTVGASSACNAGGGTYVAWCWKADGAGTSNTDGSISATVSANPMAGFSIVTFTGTGANATVGHGLDRPPGMVIIKRLDASTNFAVGHDGLHGVDPWNDYHLKLNSTAARSGTDYVWNATAPTSSVFSVGTDSKVNASGSLHVAYCFAEVPGCCKVGSYTGNASTDGPFVHLGFPPGFILVKNTDTTSNWYLWDTTRAPFNPVTGGLVANANGGTYSGTDLSITSTGFKIQDSETAMNGSGNNIVYLALGGAPIQGGTSVVDQGRAR